jgi:N-acylneuraminate cytidylyltransferase
MVSTDDEEIADVARQYGASVPFLRSGETSNDFATWSDVLSEILDVYRAKNESYDLACCLSATAPFVKKDYILTAANYLKNDSLVESVSVVSRFDYPIQRALAIRDGRLVMVWPENYSKRSQDLEPTYHDAGLFDFVRISAFLEQKTLFCRTAKAIVISSADCQDIDTLEDFEMAEQKFKATHSVLA